MKSAFIITISLLCPWMLKATPVSESELKAIRFEQRVGYRVALDTPFVDETGHAVTLGTYFGKQSVIIVPGYYECPMLCTLVLNGLTETLRDIRATAGKDYQVVAFSINPTETPALADAKKRIYLRDYGRDGASAGWHFLTGPESSIESLTRALGYHYLYDADAKQYAHPSGFIVLSPDGTINRYFFGVDYSARELDTALQAATEYRAGNRVADLFLLCFHYSPLTGKYAGTIMLTVRSLATMTLVGLGVYITRSVARERARQT